ncbi:vWA domain-containing protein [Aquisalibacillus elongatus]|uniref:Ca-activated chloride channel family protein n=1 Tax=Aquisalibacillus elongatus TaxID=485577 RepID=A0A3N5B0W2_9BACI|nr:VWA domain-containing protein [Aquisalibacillus elongatus]RPF51216.1 Ca-activated chloride channel family protein [Aquisalibacillus elongatus]
MNTGTIRQILLITDGCSNQGEDPVQVSTMIADKGVAVNVIGVLDDDKSEEPTGLSEVNEIAQSGGGISRIVYADVLSETVQTVTRQAMTQTIQGFVSKELKEIFGKETDETDLPPEERGEVQRVVEDLGETVDLQVLILVDTSASMQNKMEAVKDAIDDFILSLQARTGNHYYSIFQFPAKNQVVKELLPWTNDGAKVAKVFPKLAAGGITPTGAALKQVVRSFQNVPNSAEWRDDSDDIIDSSYGTSQ